MSAEPIPTGGLGKLPVDTSAFGRRMRKVLVIEDSPEIRMIIGETLSLFGFQTLEAEDGVTGIEVAQEHLPDLVLCDINMPNLDGYGTLKALRDFESTSFIPFIFLSGATDRFTIRKGMELGADDYLTKPFSPKELMAAVGNPGPA